MAIRTRVPVVIRPDVTSEIVSFDLKGQTAEDIAILFPGWELQKDVLVRLHSECLTGDVFGSARCDCGPQLEEAILRMSKEGGILIYLRQEGRGVGLYNKLDAYKRQIENGDDTFQANLHLGLPADARDYKIAGGMLKDLGVASVRILTNNPDKVGGLEESGIKVSEIIPTGVFETADNLHYLKAKREHGHTLKS